MSAVGAALLGAVQGALSVLLTVASGNVAARLGLLDKPSVKKVNALCTRVFLPCLLIVEMGPELTPSTLRQMWIVPVWGALSTIIAHAIGWAASRAFHLPAWTIVAAGRPNSAALPLLLLQSLGDAGALDALKRPDESTTALVARARSLVLLNAVVQQVFTFEAGPAILRRDAPHRDGREPDELVPGPRADGRPTIQDAEHVGLLQAHPHARYGAALDPLEDLPDTPRVPPRLRVLQQLVNPALVGALIALLLGMVGPLRRMLLDPSGALHTVLATPLANLGGLFVALQLFVVGAELHVARGGRPPAAPTALALAVRYAAMPALAAGAVLASARARFYAPDPLVWFLLVLIPSGPSAMLLASIAEEVDVDQAPVAGYLVVVYILSPLIAGACVLGLEVVRILQK